MINPPNLQGSVAGSKEALYRARLLLAGINICLMLEAFGFGIWHCVTTAAVIDWQAVAAFLVLALSCLAATYLTPDIRSDAP